MISLCWHKRCSICLILYIDLFELCICANNIRIPFNNLFGVKIFNPFPSFTSSSKSMSEKSTDSSFSNQSSYFYASRNNFSGLYLCSIFFFFLHLINHSIQQNMFVASHYIILKLYHTHLFFFLFVFVFLAC